MYWAQICYLISSSCSEAGRCVALVEDSVSVLLSCLEMVDLNFAWGLQEAVKCASFFRRIYEEVCACWKHDSVFICDSYALGSMCDVTKTLLI